MSRQKAPAPVIAVVGPTACGKTHLAVELAKWQQSEVVSADSMQVYQDMQIGTARPTASEMDGVPHHLLGFLPLSQEFSVADYVKLAGECLQTIQEKGKIPILVGGTGLYIRSLLQNLSFPSLDKDEALREELTCKAREHGTEVLVQELRQVDPASAERIDPQNIPRLVRAIELCRLTGKTMTQHLEESRRHPPPYRVCMIGLDFADRSRLYDRIDRRVDAMMEAGLLEEARRVLSQEGSKTALQAIGYKELAPYLAGEIPLEQAVENIKRETRRYAKRQLTWFRREEQIHWLYLDECEPGQVVEEAKACVSRFL